MANKDRRPKNRYPHRPPNLNHPVIKVISGGQVGADIAGLRAAKRLGLETGGWMTSDWRTKEGPHPEYQRKYGMTANTTKDYRQRTALNVRSSDATFRLMLNPETAGEVATWYELQYAKKPYLDFYFDPYYRLLDPDFSEHQARRWLQIHDIKVLNIAGNAYPKLEEPAEEFLLKVLGRRKTPKGRPVRKPYSP